MNESNTIKVIIVDDHELVRDGLELGLMGQNGIEVIATAGDYRGLEKEMSEKIPDVILLDIDLPQKSGIEITKSIKSNSIAPKIVMITGNDQINYLEMALRAGANGFVSKSSRKEIVVEAIQQVMRENIYIDYNLSQDVYQSLKNKLDLHQDEKELSEREIEILKGFANGLTYQQISDELHISKKTVESHKALISKKLNTKNNADLIKYAIKKGFVKLD
ncbi:response regulator transcription factor [Marivirga salinae]|uniref:Response regulator transcription factor n=1 Tax=Marivirga salinarum TaxID=3059078 RepID=A0AA51N8J6_9BACT|nr:response regulator transcription factor [Marivirga sp. BDSF4-3]WMN10669.1 response regulator transcription factor [Marivirga sp. BDSF4-3]